MTLVKIDKKQKNTIARALVEMNVEANFYTIENNDLMLQLEIQIPNMEVMWHIAKHIGHLCEFEETKRMFKVQR